MTILKTDLKLLSPERNTNFPDNGGAPSANIITDGQSNGIFPNTSNADRASGSVTLRKVFTHVDTQNTDVFADAFFFIKKPPTDPTINVLAFNTEGFFSEQTESKTKLESYVIRGQKIPYFLNELQPINIKSLSLYSRLEVENLQESEVYELVEDEGLPTEKTQFVKIEKSDSSIQTISTGNNDNCGVYDRRIHDVDTTETLKINFHGDDLTCRDDGTPQGIIRGTKVNNDAKYYGITKLSLAATIGDKKIEVEEVKNQLVPATKTDIPLTDLAASNLAPVKFTSGGTEFSLITPAHSSRKEITLGTVALTYVFSLLPIPALGSFVLSYRANNQWQTITDNGDGTLGGDGGGTVSQATGTASVTLAVLPDVGSEIIYSWGSKVHFKDNSGTLDLEPFFQDFDVLEPIRPLTFSCDFLSNGVTKTITDDGLGGLTGHGKGVVSASGKGQIIFNQFIPDSGTNLIISYDTNVVITEVFTPTLVGDVATVTLTTTPILPGSINAFWRETNTTKSQKGYDEVVKISNPLNSASGSNSFFYGYKTERNDSQIIIDRETTDYGDGTWGYPASVADYVTGVMSGKLQDNIDESSFDDGEAWVTESKKSVFGGTLTVRYMEDLAGGSAKTKTIPVDPLSIRVIPLVNDQLVAGTVRFNFNGDQYSDREGGGLLYLTDGTVAGQVNYVSKFIEISVYSGQSLALTFTSLVSIIGSWYAYDFSFRTQTSPLNPASLIINATDVSSTQHIVPTDQNGDLLLSNKAVGSVNQSTGSGSIKFGELVPDISLTLEEKASGWYDASDIDINGDIWKPLFITPQSLKYSAVANKTLTIGEDVLGVSSVKLPQDGKVKAFHAGGFCIIHNTAELVTTPVDSQVIDIGRTLLSDVIIKDFSGVSFTDFTVNLDTGILTIGTVGAAPTPFTISDTILDLVFISEVDIVNDTISFVVGLTHDYPILNTYISGALPLGDLQARYTNLFDESSWDGVTWQDSPIVGGTSAEYNDTDNPLVMTNSGAITERFVVQFTSQTNFVLIGEHLGQIATGNTSTDLSVLNPRGAPYFVLLAAGWGSGWSTGNILRFNTIAAMGSPWLALSVTPSNSTIQSNEFCIDVIGNVNP